MSSADASRSRRRRAEVIPVIASWVLRRGGAFASHLNVPTDAIWKMPAELSFTDAASIPVVFGTAFHALHSLARLRRGETILIHAAAGGVGLAAVQLAQRIGATVLATAGSDEKRALLREMGVAHVMDSRTLDFAEETLRFTGGRGVDVVLNSLAGSFQQKSLAVCAPHGRFIEIGKRDLFENRPLPLSVFQRSLAFFAFDLPSVMAARGAESAGHAEVFRLVRAADFRPVPVTTFPAREAVSAFRLMQGAQHVGKIVLEFDPAQPPDVRAEFWPDADGTYLVTGGLNGFGFATAQMARGTRRAAPRLAQPPRCAFGRGRARAGGVARAQVNVHTLAADVADVDSLAAALRRLKKVAPPIRGVFHAAMVLRDATLDQMTREALEEVLAPKIAGAWNLHEQTRALPLDCFVMFSSVSALLGAPGQANYAAANAYLDALAQHRRAEGLPALSVNWGQIADAGTAVERPEIGRYLDTIGVRALPARTLSLPWPGSSRAARRRRA